MQPSATWIIRPTGRDGARIQLFCFPRAGGGASAFAAWPKTCHPDIEVMFIQPPGRENRYRETPLTHMTELVQGAADAIVKISDRPYALYGHSLGAKVAFETARELRRRGMPVPVHFFAAASAGPGVSWNHPKLHNLDEDGLLIELQTRYGGVPNEVLADPELRALVLPVLRADIQIVETYRYSAEPPLQCPITCFGGTDDFMTPESEILDWRRQACGEFRLQMFSGGHFFPALYPSSILSSIAADLCLNPHAQQAAAQCA